MPIETSKNDDLPIETSETEKPDNSTTGETTVRVGRNPLLTNQPQDYDESEDYDEKTDFRVKT